MRKFEVPSECDVPSQHAIEQEMDKRLHKAVAKAKWEKHPFMCDIIEKNIMGSRGQYLGTLFARKVGA